MNPQVGPFIKISILEYLPCLYDILIFYFHKSWFTVIDFIIIINNNNKIKKNYSLLVIRHSLIVNVITRIGSFCIYRATRFHDAFLVCASNYLTSLPTESETKEYDRNRLEGSVNPNNDENNPLERKLGLGFVSRQQNSF